MKKIRLNATKLRKQGKSYSEINKLLGVPKGTLSSWFKNIEWSRNISKQNIDTSRIKNSERIKKLNKIRSCKLEKSYQEAKIEATKEYEEYKNQPVFIAGLMLYLGEGDKTNANNLVRIANIDFYVLKIFLKFLVSFCGISKSKIRFWVLLYPDLDLKECEEKWQKELNLNKENFYKAQRIKGRHKTKRLIYGVGNIILGDKRLKIKILKWIELLSKDLSK